MLINEPFIAREQGSGTFKSLKDCLSANGFDPSTLSIIATMGNTAAVCQAVKSGLGISVLSPRAVKDELKQRTLTALDIEGVDLSRHFYLTRHKNRSQSPLCETFQDFLKPCLKKL